MSKKGILFVASGPSGSGKTTLCRMVEKKFGIPHSISYTTRAPRGNESHGKDYHFISNTEFDRMIKSGAFLEWAVVHGNRYGTGVADTERFTHAGHDLILDLDTQGALEVKLKQKGAILIFIDVPDNQMLADRLGKRGTEDEEMKNKRLSQAEKERSFKESYNFSITNDDLDKTFEAIVSIIETERKSRGEKKD